MKKMIAGIVAAVVLLSLPFILWLTQQQKTLEVAIIDKTVPSESYREHKGLTWILNHNRYVTGSRTNYEKDSGYYGFMPDEAEESYEIKDVTELGANYDLIYLADTYGVYQEDLPWQPADSECSELIYGGLQMAEWQTVKQQVMDGGTDLVVEFNTFASPTEQAVSADMEAFLGVEWSGWTGRYFAVQTIEATS